jgi:sulfite exporter TauE/SafE
MSWSGAAVYALVFGGGVAGSLHCVGMCGVFTLALAGGGRRVGRQLLYNLARVNTLVAIGAVSGGVGAAVVGSGPASGLGHALAVVASLVMLVVGLEILGVDVGLSARAAGFAHAALRRALGGALASRSAAAPVALGVFNAFLPCQLVYAFAARAASTASVGAGMLTMLAFGLGTVPAMLAVGVLGGTFERTLRARLSLASGVLVLAFAAVTLLRGLDLLPHAGHAH